MGDILNMHGIPGIIKEKNFLNVLLNDKPAVMSPKELFDHGAFDRISLATYVASPSYLARLKDFGNVRLIVGEEETGRRMVILNDSSNVLRPRFFPLF